MPKRKTAKPVEYEIEIEGQIHDVERVRLRLGSFNKAIGGGVPLRTGLEVFGYTHVGKSTLCYELGFEIAKQLMGEQKGRFGIVDTEGSDPAYIQAIGKRNRFKGSLWFAPLADEKGRPQSGIEQLDALRSMYMDKVPMPVMLIDSLGALQMPSTLQGSVGEAKMGQRAKSLNEAMRAMVFDLRYRELPGVLLMTNHAHPILNGQGTTTTGGVGPSFLCKTRIRLSIAEGGRKEDSTIAQGIVEKLTFKPPGVPWRSQFQVVMLPGYGVHVGLTAVNDCIQAGLATNERTIKLGNKSFGFWSKMVEQHLDDDLFAPFLEAWEKEHA